MRRERSTPMISTVSVVSAQTGGVDQRDGNVVDDDFYQQLVARRAGDVGHDRSFLTDQAVEKAGFSLRSDVRLANF
jgi:hypothetical protein